MPASNAPVPHALPVIDLSAADDPRTREAFHRDLLAAARDVGFLHLTGHGVEDREIARIMELTRAFFALPEADRLALSNLNSPHFRGYTRIGHELTGGRSDWRDQLDVGAERPAVEVGPGDPAYLWLEGPNQWPAALPELRTAVLAWQDRLAAVAHRLLRELLTALGAPADHFDGAFADRPHLHTKLVRYPGSAPAGDGQGVGAHKDYGFLTLLLQDEVGGLQVRSGDGYLDVPPLPGAFVVNLGELLEIATDGYLSATDHRVVSPPGAVERFSVPFFYNPRLDAVIGTVPGAYLEHAPGIAEDRANPLHAEYGRNELKGWLRAHPEVARRHHPGLVAG
ncbi:MULTISPECIES: isopenicillin N synthase family dioxygenase [Streptomyces]|uniref:Isopenicillin N synthase family oxygenase n=1 Tax=Streptomyces sudanensis TaxID=436397 RepID=A0ABY4T9S3_9ACTN|nr:MULTISPECIES: 2-oxoglutarate and iron-dependent oxygenase domain-containing protein [Streptomyces]MCP9956264.1 isopenicillin N synthase family oxygenase [Streptomyces sudanensis]MCP9985476.1 isopenicillin N synthase family oxygenase [Streptomyces sudanensis]URN14693.1 isopenicillin N synthase family oxygenase [Streptomyces sudanensis]